MLNKRRIVIDVTRAGWIGWTLFALLIIPLLVLLLLFAAILVPVVLIVLLVTGARIYWLMQKARRNGASFDIEPANVCESDVGGENASPPKQLPPPSA